MFRLDDILNSGCTTTIPGQITKVKGPPTYLIPCGNKVRFLHVDHSKSTGYELAPKPVADRRAPLEGLPYEREYEEPRVQVVSSVLSFSDESRLLITQTSDSAESPNPEGMEGRRVSWEGTLVPK